MSVWMQVLGWGLIALGTWSTFSAIRNLRQLTRRGKCEMIKPALRREAWRSVLFGPLSFTWGVYWISYRWTHDVLVWLLAAYAVMLAIWSLGSRFWFSNKDGQAAGQP